ncbi:DUF547 domain-containing protein [Coralliovum pocilloporae]|uniref:DUF547 domain-containing protein n=1 Tax=Coralliovum pocilloporae TaxID=3066369 RepID=UPI003306A75C
MFQTSLFPKIGKAVLLAGVVTMTAAFGSGERIFAPDADAWSVWRTSAKSDTRTIDHSRWGDVLKKYVRKGRGGVNLFAYRSVSSSDKAKLDAYIKDMTALKISSYNRNVQKAYWINLYNALTIQVVLDNKPVKSIRDIDISPGLFADGPWGKKLVTIEGRKVSLNDIEHRILRPLWRDARIHYAVNCASIGCPNLQTRPFTGKTVNGQLSKGARDYVNNARGVSVKNGKVTVSKIYDWFYEDFGKSDKDVLNHILKYANADLKRQLQSIGKIHDVKYDWSLNGS